MDMMLDTLVPRKGVNKAVNPPSTSVELWSWPSPWDRRPPPSGSPAPGRPPNNPDDAVAGFVVVDSPPPGIIPDNGPLASESRSAFDSGRSTSG